MSNVQPLSQGESLAVGDQGDQVEELQRNLQHVGYYQGQLDGYYGELLEAAVKEFQRAAGHDDDGRTGAETWHEIEHQAASAGDGQEVAPAEQAADPSAIQVGQLSEDGSWQWNGTDWVAAGTADAGAQTAAVQVGQLSEDGHWQWDGTAWKAAGGDAAATPAEQAGQPEPAGQGNGHSAEGAGQGANHPALAADPSADIPKLSQDDFHMAIADTMTVHAGEEA
jgi:hypothetical protein